MYSRILSQLYRNFCISRSREPRHMGVPAALVLVALVFTMAPLVGAEQKPSLKLINSIVQVVPGSGDSGVADLLVQAEDFPTNGLGHDTPKLEDLRVPATPALQISTPQLVRELSRTETGA